MIEPMTPGSRLTLARIAAGYETPKVFYTEFKIHQGTYSAHETGIRGIRPEIAEKYASCLKNCSAGWILFGEGDGPSFDRDGTFIGEMRGQTAAPIVNW